MKLNTVNPSIDNILLDPNNYRFREEEDFILTQEDKFHLLPVQNKAYSRLRNDVKELVKSIKSNGFLLVERIILAKYSYDDDKYYVLEGNRRIAALRRIKEEIDEGIYDDEDLSKLIDAVPCLVADELEDFPGFKQSLMGIRHVGGIKQWGGFQRAQLIADLRDTFDLDPGVISERIGLSVHEITRRYRAFSALRQMMEDEEFGELAKPSMYPLFHEAVSLPAVKDWLGWHDAESAFTKDNERAQFYELIAPLPVSDDEPVREPKITTYNEIRSLRDILSNPQAKSYLLDPSKKFSDALTVASKAELSQKWRDEVKQATSALGDIGALELGDIDENDLLILNDLIKTAQKIIELRGKFSS